MSDISVTNFIKKMHGKSLGAREYNYSEYGLNRLRGICVHDALYIFYRDYFEELFDYIDIPTEEKIIEKLNLFGHKAYYDALKNLFQKKAQIYGKNRGKFLFDCINAMQWELELLFKRIYRDFKMGYPPKEIVERNKPLLIEEDLVLRLPHDRFLYAKPDIIYRNNLDLILTDYKVYKSKPSIEKLHELGEVILLYVIIYNNNFKQKITRAQIRLLNQREDVPIEISEEITQKFLKRVKL
ncbi:MAG: hypothetical protein ACFFDH_02405 [Promethearchaeota archaeon]